MRTQLHRFILLIERVLRIWLWFGIRQHAEFACLDFVEKRPDSGHDLLKLMLRQIGADKQRYNTRQDLRPDLVRTKGIARFLVDLEHEHADLWVVISA